MGSQQRVEGLQGWDASNGGRACSSSQQQAEGLQGWDASNGGRTCNRNKGSSAPMLWQAQPHAAADAVVSQACTVGHAPPIENEDVGGGGARPQASCLVPAAGGSRWTVMWKR